MTTTAIIIIVCIGLFMVGVFGSLLYCEISTRKMVKAEKAAAKNNK